MKSRVFLPAVLSGVLLWVAYFPLDLGPLAYVALVPWLMLVRGELPNRRSSGNDPREDRVADNTNATTHRRGARGRSQ